MSKERYIKGVDISADEVEDDVLLPPDNGIVWDKFTAGEVLNGFRVCYLGSDSKVYLASNLDLSTISKSLLMTRHSALEDEEVECVLSGKVKNQGWGLTAGARYFLTTGGQISTSPASSGYLFEVGTAENSNTLIINFTRPVIRN